MLINCAPSKSDTAKIKVRFKPNKAVHQFVKRPVLDLVTILNMLLTKINILTLFCNYKNQF